ncbi:MAG: gliding motility-associated C-terminal domain-containing protein, partial [Flavobacteriales bacterium]
VTQIPLPVFSLGPASTLCPGEQDTLDATLPGASYIWNTGAVSPTLVVGPGTWSVAVTLNGCSATDSVEVAALAAPVVDLGSDTTLCPGGAILLDASTPGVSYAWNDDSTGPTLTVNSAGIRAITVTDSSGCTATDSIMVDLAVLPTLDLGNDTAICTGGQLLLDAALPGASGYLWNQGATTDTLSVHTADVYVVNVMIGHCEVQDTIVVTELPLPLISLGSDTVLCPLTQLTLDPAGSSIGLVWQDGSTGTSFLVSAAGTYSVTATGANGCESRDSISVVYVDPGNFGLGPDTTLCSGNTLFLNTGIAGGSTVWTGAIDTLANTLAASTSGTYIAETSFGTCSLSDSITIMFLPLPVLDLGPDQQLCTGSSSQLAPALDNGVSLIWDDGSTAPIRTIDQAGTYWAVATLNGCTTEDTLLVTSLPTPIVDLGADTALCGDATLMLNAAISGASYIWNDGAAVGDRSVGAGFWYVQVEADGCIGTDSIAVTSLPLPGLDLPTDTTLCSSSTWAIDVDQAGASYLWSDGSVAPVFTVDTPGIYSVIVDRAGCVDSAQVVVSYVDLSALELGMDTLLCPGTSLQLTVNIPGTSIVWQDGSTGMAQTVHTTGTYGVVVSLSGCMAADSIHVSYSSIPTPQLGPDRTLCSGDSLILQVSPGSALAQWSTGEVGPSITVNTAGEYTVILLQDGCTSSDHVQVALIHTIDEVDLGPDREVCPGYPLTLDATIPGATYAWNNGNHSAVLTTDQPGTYIVHAQGQCILAADTVVLTDINCEPRIYVPNAFTPNDDDINDHFAPSMDEQVLSWTLKIYDRWGSMVHTSTPDNASWDGNIASGPAPPGVYVWVLEYKTHEGGRPVDRTERGSVVLLR